jgi:hypothetical protein
MTNAEIHCKLVHAVTNYDRKQSTKRGYNVYALPQYFAALDEVLKLVDAGKMWPQAISAVFNDRLEAFLLRSLPA